MKIAIITWCSYINFGTYLQAYALQHYLNSLGYDVSLLDDSEFIVDCGNISYLHRCLRTVKFRLKKIVKPSFKKRLLLDRTSIRLFKDFRNKYLVLDKDVLPLSNVDNRYDLFICGSDQIWNPAGLADSNKTNFFFANFAHTKKISYASSLGVIGIPQKYKKHFSELISDFSYLSVREKTGMVSLKELTNKEITNVVDPTLLLSLKEWNQLIDGRYTEIKDNYVLLYILSYNENYIKYALSFASKHHLDIKIIQSTGVDFKKLQTEIAGPLEFLHLIKRADYVLTDSFHGTIFSIIFEKQFLAFKRFDDIDNCSKNTRVSCLLKICRLENRFIGRENFSDIDNLDKVDFEIVKKYLDVMISTSKDYLKKAINQ